MYYGGHTNFFSIDTSGCVQESWKRTHPGFGSVPLLQTVDLSVWQLCMNVETLPLKRICVETTKSFIALIF